MVTLLKKIIGDPGEKAIDKIAQTLVPEINALESPMQARSDEQLYDLTRQFRDRLARDEALDDLLPEAFAAVREVARRNLGQRHYDVQLIGGIVLHRGQIAEMKTGEGKTLVATLPVYLNALTGQRRPRGYRQRLPGPPRPGMDGAHLPQPGPHRGLPAARRGFHVRPNSVRRRSQRHEDYSGQVTRQEAYQSRRALRHQQRVRVRLSCGTTCPWSRNTRCSGSATTLSLTRWTTFSSTRPAPL